MKKLITVLLLALALTACDKQKVPAIATGATVLILGDSLSYGTGANKGEDYPTLLASYSGWNIVNAGVPGDTSEGGLARLPGLLKTHQPKLLIIELGGNDFLRRIPHEQTIQNLKAIITQAKAKGVPTLLIAIPELNPMKAAFGSLSDHPLYGELAAETDSLLIEDAFSEVLSDNALKADHIHPNAEGYRVVEQKLRDSLIDMGLLETH